MYCYTLNSMTKQFIQTNLTVVAEISTTNLKFNEKRVSVSVKKIKKRSKQGWKEVWLKKKKGWKEVNQFYFAKIDNFNVRFGYRHNFPPNQKKKKNPKIPLNNKNQIHQ